ncbi:MAG TPA: nuclear transport factor 2 family protein [Actinomycetospora sp.]|jgi:ketosteroid isomerase-like protein|uniref:ester cyclase n=1 Tax=Actinomycetospora sp. TaxID=1872135 RepID=UPI002F40F36E
MTIREIIEKGTELYNKGDVDGFCALYRADAVLTTPDGRFEGPENMKPYFQGLYDAFPSGGVSVGRGCEDGDLYCGEFMMEGVNTGPLAMPDGTELPATHRSVELPAMEIARVENGEIVEHRFFWDNLAFMSQLGLGA